MVCHVGHSCSRNRSSALCTGFDSTEMRFIETNDGRGDGLSGIDLKINNMEHVLRESRARKLPPTDNQVLICGIRANLIKAAIGSRTP